MKQYTSSKKQKGTITGLPAINQSKLGHYQFISKKEGIISTLQLESFLKALKHSLPKDLILIQRVFISRPVTSKPLEVRMGKGKGNIDGKRRRRRRWEVRVWWCAALCERDGAIVPAAADATRRGLLASAD